MQAAESSIGNSNPIASSAETYLPPTISLIGVLDRGLGMALEARAAAHEESMAGVSSAAKPTPAFQTYGTFVLAGKDILTSVLIGGGLNTLESLGYVLVDNISDHAIVIARAMRPITPVGFLIKYRQVSPGEIFGIFTAINWFGFRQTSEYAIIVNFADELRETFHANVYYVATIAPMQLILCPGVDDVPWAHRLAENALMALQHGTANPAVDSDSISAFAGNIPVNAGDIPVNTEDIPADKSE